MKKIISTILALSLFSSLSYGTTVTTLDGTVCDFSKTVHNADGTVTYPASLHNCVGKLVQDNSVKTQQIVDLHKAIDLYTLTIQTDEKRIETLSSAFDKVSARVDKADELRDKNYWIYFGLGVLATGAAAYTAAKLSGH